jgi:3-oxoadipate enol-lactonase
LIVALIEYRQSGQGPCLVLIHSLATQGEAWDAHAAWLVNRGYHVLQIDVRGHGRSGPAGAGCTLVSLADDVRELLDSLGVARAHVLGLSMGGMIAQQLALDHPQRVSALIIAASTARNSSAARQAWDERIALARSEGMQALVEPLLQRWFTPAFREQQPQTPKRLGQWIAAMDINSFAACSAIVRDVDTLDRLRDLRVPTLVLAGAEDPATPPATVEAIARAIPAAQFRVVPAAAHWLPLEQPQRFQDELAAFLSGV